MMTEAAESGSPADWRKAVELGKNAYRQQQLAAAEEQLLAAAKMAETSGCNATELALIFDWLSHVVACRHDYQAAGAYAGRALASREAAFGAESAELVRSLVNVAWTRLLGHDTDAAELAIGRALAIAYKAADQDEGGLALGLCMSAAILDAKGERQQAQEQFSLALEAAEGILEQGFQQIDRYCEVVTGMAQLCAKHDAYKARECLERMLRAQEKAVGPNHPRLAECLLELAQSHMQYGQCAEAMPHLERAVHVRESVSGDGDRWLQKALWGLAEAQSRMVDWAGAQATYERLAGLIEKQAAPADLARVLERLGYVLGKQSRFGEALGHLGRACSILEAGGGGSQPLVADVLVSMAGVYCLQREFVAAEEACKRAIKVLESERSEDRRLMLALTGYAKVLQSMGREREAEEMLARVRAIWGNRRGDE